MSTSDPFTDAGPGPSTNPVMSKTRSSGTDSMASKALAPEDIHKFFKFCLDALRKGVPLPSTTNQFAWKVFLRPLREDESSNLRYAAINTLIQISTKTNSWKDVRERLDYNNQRELLMGKIENNIKVKGLSVTGRKKRKSVHDRHDDSEVLNGGTDGKENRGLSTPSSSNSSKKKRLNLDSGVSPAEIARSMNLDDQAMKAKSDRIQPKKGTRG